MGGAITPWDKIPVATWSLKAIKLLAPHEHAGREYPAGAVLDLELHGLDLDSAAWLIGLGKAEEHTPAAAE